MKQNGWGIAGFVCSLVGLVLSWTGYGAVALLPLGFIFSIVGICNGRNRGERISLAIAGLVLSVLDLIVGIIVFIIGAAFLAGLLGGLQAMAFAALL